eukprot:GILJ01004367.1.p1 GENE.GILJ01004367.1~~GILJ01004367.1.p1  ORF type:complete len:612 (-),score=99.96 GILJ01004367.1:226-2061(-)
MSRHRNVRKYTYDEDDYDDYDEQEDYVGSPASPSLSSYMYQRDGPPMASFALDQNYEYEMTEEPQDVSPPPETKAVKPPPGFAPAATKSAGPPPGFTAKTPSQRFSFAEPAEVAKKPPTPPKQTTTPPPVTTPPTATSKIQAASTSAASTGTATTPPPVTTGAPAPTATKIPAPEEVEDEVTDSEGMLHLNMITVGHVDAGKSTLMGHLLYQTGNVNSKQMHKFQKESRELGKASFAYAWVLDENAEERARGVTIDVGRNYLRTPTKLITLLDAPGHKDFIPNMISGAAQADVAILVVDANTGEFEAGFEANGQTREHALLVRSLGIQQLIVAINKLDALGWSESRFEEIVGRLAPFLKQSGFKDKLVTFIPVSGLTGENLIQRSDQGLSWYTGPSLMEAIESFEPPSRATSQFVRLCVADVYRSPSLGMAVSGKVESGVVRSGSKVVILPANVLGTVKTMEHHGEPIKRAVAGQNIEVGLTGVDFTGVSIGSVLCDVDHPISLVSIFKCQLLTFNLPSPIVHGQSVLMHIQSASYPATISKLLSVTDKATGETSKKKPRALLRNTAATVEVTVSRPVCLELYSACRPLGRVTFRDRGTTLAAGIVTEVIQ